MPACFRIGKQRYCQGLPLLASLTVLDDDTTELTSEILLEPLEEGMEPTEPYIASGFMRSNGYATAFLELDTDEISPGTYNLVTAKGSAVSSPIMILTKEEYGQLLDIENNESFDDDLIPARDVYRFVESIIPEYWTRAESLPALLRDRVMRSGFCPSLSLSGQSEAPDRMVSVAKLRYGSEAILCDLSYLAAVPLEDAARSEQSALDVRTDHRGNLLLYARTGVGVARPDQLLEPLLLYSDVAQLPRFHSAIFSSQIGIKGVNTIEISVTVTAESEKGSRAQEAEAPLASAGGSAARQPEYA